MQIDEFIQENYAENISDIETWVDEQYNAYFKTCFDYVRSIHKNMQSQVRQISDVELESILTELPMMLFSISESLNKVKLEQEVIKLKKKSIKLEIENKAAQAVADKLLQKTDVKSYVDAKLSDHDVLIAAYGCLITRVDSEISFSKELIMGCKKIWDARRRTENSNPVSEVTPDKMSDYSSYKNPERYHEPYVR